MTAAPIRWPALPPIRYPVALAPLAAAYLLAPYAVALAGFWLMLIPVFAVVIGYIPYVVMGTLSLLIFAGRIDITVRNSALMGLVNYLIFAVGFVIWVSIYDPNPYRPSALNIFLFVCGLVFAPLWCATAALLYRFFTRQHKGDTP